MRIGVLCSGGDAPGMNACLRAVVRAAASEGHEVIGIRRGYEGLINADFFDGEDGKGRMSPRAVSHILERGGTMLKSSRCRAFASPSGLQAAADVLKRTRIDGLIPIGGDGTFRGAHALGAHWNGQIIGCPGTIDNDLLGTDSTIGFSTAVATAVSCIDKLRDTAESHERLFLVEVMGRDSGHLALATALAGSAEIACVPEEIVDAASIAQRVEAFRSLGKQSIIIVVAEGDEQGGAVALNEKLAQANCPYATRTVILGHVQRGGSPTAEDRILATRLGDFVVRSLFDGATGMMTGESAGHCQLVPLPETFERHRPLPDHQIELLERMSC